MSTVVAGEARRRWVVVVAGTAVLVAVLGIGPWVRAAVGVGAPSRTPEEVVARALASASVPFSAVNTSRGGLALPDVTGFGDLASLLGGTTRTRVWWQDPQRWRVDTVDATGEKDTYGGATSVTTWDYESRRLTTVVGDPAARLPRADDLVAPAAARRLLGSVGPDDRLSALPSRRVDGRDTDAVRIHPGDDRSTIAHADVWVDRATGLPLRLTVVGDAGGDALTTELDRVEIGAPPADVLRPPAPPIARRSLEDAPDLVARLAGQGFWSLPERLIGLPASGAGTDRSAVPGATTYGDGLTRVTVLLLPPEVSGQVVANATSAGAATEDVTGGQVLRIGSSLLNAALVRDDDGVRAYLVAGLVTPATLDDAAHQLLTSPPNFRPPGE